MKRLTLSLLAAASLAAALPAGAPRAQTQQTSTSAAGSVTPRTAAGALTPEQIIRAFAA